MPNSKKPSSCAADVHTMPQLNVRSARSGVSSSSPSQASNCRCARRQQATAASKKGTVSSSANGAQAPAMRPAAWPSASKEKLSAAQAAP